MTPTLKTLLSASNIIKSYLQCKHTLLIQALVFQPTACSPYLCACTFVCLGWMNTLKIGVRWYTEYLYKKINLIYFNISFIPVMQSWIFISHYSSLFFFFCFFLRNCDTLFFIKSKRKQQLNFTVVLNSSLGGPLALHILHVSLI